jgi:hypothetical protein
MTRYRKLCVCCVRNISTAYNGRNLADNLLLIVSSCNSSRKLYGSNRSVRLFFWCGMCSTGLLCALVFKRKIKYVFN